MKRLNVGIVAALFSAIATAGVGVWTTNGPPGPVTGVVTDLGTPGIVYAAGQSGIFKSTDNGATWVMTSPFGSGVLGAYAPLAAGPLLSVYASGPYGSSPQGTTIGLFVSHDGGGHWSVSTSGNAGTSYMLAIDPVTPTNLYLAHYLMWSIDELSQFMRSADGGATWSTLNEDLGRITTIAVAPTSPTTVYLTSARYVESGSGLHAGLWRSQDSGTTWTRINASLTDLNAVAVDPTNSSTVYVASLSARVLKSVDGGSTLLPANAGLPTFVTALCIDPARPDRVYAATSGGVFGSNDAGVTWQPMNNGLASSDLGSIRSLAIDATGTYLHVAMLSGVFDYEVPTPCASDAFTLCLNGSRFSVSTSFQAVAGGPTSSAQAVLLTSDTGYFWFFDPANVEIVTKVLNGCSVNGNFWFFASGLTNLGVLIKVTDTQSLLANPVAKSYTNNVGTPFAPVQDTTAFSTCP